MKRILALGLAAVVGCSDKTGPIDSTPIEGMYALTAIDGNALPVTVIIDGDEAPVIAGYLELNALRFIAVNLTVGPVAGSGARSFAVSGQYRQITPDSAVFPRIASPEVFLRRTGSTVVVVTEPAGSGFGPARALGGAHRFTFVEE